MSSRWSKALPPTPKESPYTLPATVPEEESPTGTPPAQHRRPASTPPPPIGSPFRRLSRPRPRRPVPRKPVQIEEVSSEKDEEPAEELHTPSTSRAQAPRSPSSPSSGVSVRGRRISMPKPRKPVLRKPVAPVQPVNGETSPNGGSGGSEQSYSPQNPQDAEAAATAVAATKKKPKGIVRFRLSALVVQGALRLSRGTSAALARSSSLVSTRSKSSSAARETTKRREPLRPIDIDVLHAGPGGIFEPDPEVNPLREAIRRANTRTQYNAAQDSSNSSSTPSPSRKRRKRPHRRSTDPHLRQPQQPAPVITPNQRGPLAMADPAHFPSRSVPSSRNPAAQSSRNGRFMRNPIGLEAYVTEPVALPPSTRPPPKTAVGRFLRAVWDLPWRSHTHVTVTYIPASAKPNGAGPESWFRSKKSKDVKNASPGTVPDEAAYARGSRYQMHQDLVPGVPVQIYSSTAPPVTIAPPGAVPLNVSPSHTWFYDQQMSLQAATSTEKT